MITITEKTVARILNPKVVNRCVEQAFLWAHRGVIQMPPKVYLDVKDGDFRAMPVYFQNHKQPYAAVKWVNVHPSNRKKKLPIVMATLLLNDARTGQLLANMQATTLTAYRTGGAGAVASKLLAKPNAKTLLLVGAGVQAYYQIKCHLAAFKLKTIVIWSNMPEPAKSLIQSLGPIKGVRILHAETLKPWLHQADIICTCTPSRKPLFSAASLQDAVHINAIGADAPGKQELSLDILAQFQVLVDDWEQASHSGEINRAVTKGLIHQSMIWGPLGKALQNKRAVAELRNKQTVFDSTGIAAQDIVLARYVFEHSV